MNAEETARDIESMKIRGAGRIARAGVEAMKHHALSYKGSDLDGFQKEMQEARDVVVNSRPTAISLWNGLQSALKGLEKVTDVEEGKKLVSSNADLFVRDSLQAMDRIGQMGSRRISDGDTVLTHCNSHAAISVIKTAHAQGKRIKVYATESRPWRQGILTVNELAKEGIDVTLIIDGAVRSVMRKVNIVLVGADTITSSGVLINKIGTSQIALAAQEARVPFLVCSETYKFSPKTLFGDLVHIEERDAGEIVKEGEIPSSVKVFNPVFDATPPEYIDTIVTEIGLIPPFAAYEVIVKKLGSDYVFDNME
ncbi:MAG: ribose 1,5-bisphosphate isomerase [Candidatus Methanomethylophilaceae archaeon]